MIFLCLIVCGNDERFVGPPPSDACVPASQTEFRSVTVCEVPMPGISPDNGSSLASVLIFGDGDLRRP